MHDSAEAGARLELPQPYHLRRTMSGLRMGAYDPAFQLEERTVRLALRTPEGPASLEVVQGDDGLSLRGWGEGAPWLLERAGPLVGLEDRPERFAPADRTVKTLWRRYSGMHLPRLPRVLDRVVQVVLLQLVTFQEGFRAWRRIVLDLGQPAPGPHGLSLPPDASRLRSTPDHVFVGHGVLPRQARTIRHLAGHAPRIEAAAEKGADALARMLGAIPGVGPWTVQYVLGSALGVADAVLPADYNLPRSVAWTLAGEERGDESRMLELLEPYRPHRYRVIRLVWMHGARAPRRGPRRAIRRLEPLKRRW